MTEQFKIEDEHRPIIRTYRLVVGGQIIARDVNKDFVDLLASAGLLLETCEVALPIVEAEAERRDYAHRAPDDADKYWTEMRELVDQLETVIALARGKQPEVVGYL